MAKNSRTFLKPLLPFVVLMGGVLACHAEPESSPSPSSSPAHYNREIVVTSLLQTTTTADGKPIVYPKTDSPEVRMLLVEIPPGTETGWHRHPMPCYGYVLSGSITVELEGGGKNTYKAGEALAETVNTLHNGKNTGSEPVRILMTVTGSKGVPTTERARK